MSRRRSRTPTHKIEKEDKHRIIKKPKPKKQFYVVLMLIGIFCMVLFLNSYFNFTSGIAFNPEGTTLGTRFYLAGPDPYYNMRTCEQMMSTGSYPSQSNDLLLNYPIGERGARPPLFNTIAVISATALSPFMSEIDALGWAMLFLPAIYGALLIFPVYGIGKELFNRRVGIIAAFFVAIIPIHISSGHGSAFSLFDHDSFLLLLFATTFYFIIKNMKSNDINKSVFYSILGGISISAIYFTWVASRYVFVLLLLYLVVQFVFGLFKHKHDIRVPMMLSITSLTAFVILLPYMFQRGVIIDYPLILLIGCLVVTGVTHLLNKVNLPWTVTVPAFSTIAAGGLFLLHFFYIKGALSGIFWQISYYLFAGLYANKVSLTIAEAGTFGISQSIMSFGPVLYWLGMLGFILYVYKTYNEKWHPANLFFITIFLFNLWLTTSAGRFMNDFIPALAICGAYMTYRIVEKINISEMFEGLKHIDIKHFYKPIKITHITGVFFIVALLIFPNAYLTLDAAVPPEMKEDVFGADHQGFFGTSLGKSYYWSEACHWLSQQDTEIENDADRPATISWWDYGFYLSSMSKHPTVADNYQSGIPPAANFKLASSEEQATAVLILRLCEGARDYSTGILPENVKEVLIDYFPDQPEIILYIEKPETSPSYNTLIAPEYGNTQLYKSPENAMYHDCSDIITTLNDEQITQLYMDIKEATGYSIRYYATEAYDTQIFTVFCLLSDRGTHGYVTSEDDYIRTVYTDKNSGIVYTESMLNNMTQVQIGELDLTAGRENKQGYFDTMWFKTYYGTEETRLPTCYLRHWKAVYLSPYVVITKYYEGAKIVGRANVGNQSYVGAVVGVFDEYGIPHDISQTNELGMFSLIAPAGNLTLSLFMADQKLQDISVNVTEPESFREVQFQEVPEFVVDYASLSCIVQTNQSDLVLRIGEDYYNISVGNTQFSLIDIQPKYYDVQVTNSTGSYLYSDYVFLKPGDNNISVDV